jgi:hypothetical protein
VSASRRITELLEFLAQLGIAEKSQHLVHNDPDKTIRSIGIHLESKEVESRSTTEASGLSWKLRS